MPHTFSPISGMFSWKWPQLVEGSKRLAAFVADNAKAEKPLTHLTFLLNFLDALRRKAPTDK